MTSQGIFVGGFLITLVVCIAFGILAYGIVLDRRYNLAADQQLLGPEPAEPASVLVTDPRAEGLLRSEPPRHPAVSRG